MRLCIIFSLLFVITSCDDKKEKLQLQSIILENAAVAPSTTTAPTTTAKTSSSTISVPGTTPPPEPVPQLPQINCTNITDVTFLGQSIKFSCGGSVTFDDYQSKLIITTSDSKANPTLPSNKKANYTIKLNNGKTISDSFTVGNPINSVQTTSQANSSVDTDFFVLRTANYMRILTNTNSHTQAVVVAVLEGLILLAIIIVFIYKECFTKNKSRPPASFPGPGSASYTANPYGSSGAGVSYGAGNGTNSFYDGVAEAYRRDHGGNGNETTLRNNSYGYDQPPIRTEERAPPSSVNRTTSPPQNRVQTETPSLVPVPLGSDPLNQWGDQRGGRPSNDLFS